MRNRTFLVRFGDITGELGRATVLILVRCNRAKIARATPIEPGMPPKCAKKYDYSFTVPKFGQVSMIPYPYHVSTLIFQKNRTVYKVSDWLISNSGRVKMGVSNQRGSRVAGSTSHAYSFPVQFALSL